MSGNSEGQAKVETYIAKSQPFAQPILEHIRHLIHVHCPDAEEALKWGMPAFVYKGKIMATMAAFKQHASFGFWRVEAVAGDKAKLYDGMGDFGRLTTLADLPADEEIASMIAKAMAIIDAGKPRTPQKTSASKVDLPVPSALAAALDAHPGAKAVFQSFSPSARREYVEWVRDAKRKETRDRRIAQTVEWLAEGKKRNWKYENC